MDIFALADTLGLEGSQEAVEEARDILQSADEAREWWRKLQGY